MNSNTHAEFDKTLVLIETLRILRNDENRKSRKFIYEYYLDNKKNNQNSSFALDDIQNHIIKVQGDFDEIGFLMEYGYLDEFPFFELYSDVVCRMWDILKKSVKKERNLRSKDPNSKDFLQFFEKLAKRALKYRKTRGLPKPTVTDLRYQDYLN